MTVIAMGRTEIDRMSVQDQGSRGIGVDETLAASGVSAGEGVRQAWAAGAGVATARQAKQPLLSDGFPCRWRWRR